MSVAVAADRVVIAGPRVATETLRAVLLWLMAFAGGFVFIEPGPYEVVGLATVLIFAATGLTLRPALVPFILLLLLLNLGYTLSLFQVVDQTPALIWVVTSVYLAITAVFFAAMLAANTEARLRWLMKGYIAAAVVVSVLAIGGYFHLFGSLSDAFVIFSRAKATFKDPNVFGAFLVLPGLLLFQRVLRGRRSQVLGGGLLLLLIVVGIFLSFSRAAWGQFLFAALVVMALGFLTSHSPKERFRIVLVAIAGGLSLIAFIVALLSVDQVEAMFRERFALTQSYDTGHVGRFGRFSLAIDMLLDYPLGLGPLQFLFPEAPHNTYLNSYITGGWISGPAYLTLTLVTLAAGLRWCFLRTPWQPSFHVVYAAYLGVVAESAIIDTDHWRHYFLTIGVLWGLMAASRAHARPTPQAP